MRRYHLNLAACGRVMIVMLCLCLASSPSLAAEELAAGDIEQKIEEVNLRTDLPEETRATLVGQLETAQKQLLSATDLRDRAEEFKGSADNVKQEVRRFEQLLAEARANPVDTEGLVSKDAKPEEIESQIALLEAERSALSERRSELLQLTEGWTQRREDIQARLVEIQSHVEDIQSTLKTPPDSLKGEVQELVARARLQALTAEREALEQETLSKPARLETISAERDWIARALADTDLKMQALNKAAEAARADLNREKLESVAAIKEELQDLSPALSPFAEQNQLLASQLKRYSVELEQARDINLAMQTQLEDIEQDSALMTRRLEVAGRKEVLGQVMMTRLDKLPNTELVRREISQRNDLIAERSLTYIDTDEELRAIRSRDRYIETHLPGADLENPELADLVGRLVDQRRQLLNSTNDNLKVLLRALVENNETSSNLILVTDRFQTFLVGNLMWVRNFGYLKPQTLFTQLQALLSPRDWLAVPADLLNGFRQHGWSAALIFLFLITLAMRRPLRAAYRERLSQPALLNVGTLWNIVLCLFLTLLIVLPWPLLLFIGGFFLEAARPSRPFLEALSPALISASLTLYALLLARLLMNPIGVGRRLLKWDSRMLDTLRGQLDWAGPVALASILLDRFAVNLEIAPSGGPLGAIATATLATTLIVFSLRLLRLELFSADRTIRLSLRAVAFMAAIVLLLLILGLLFAAERYLWSLCWTIAVVLLIKLLSDVIARALLILRARLERKTKEEIRALQEDEDSTGELESRMDMDYLTEAHAKLLNIIRLIALAGVLWMIWSSSLPALNLLDSVALWEVSDSSNPNIELRTITLFDLALGVVILIITGLIAKHLPAIVQLFLMEWANISAGARYASSILMQYVVVAVGGSMFLSTVGWAWSNLQWLVAALGVGIGFGLQEIVANFISGIIILFEQPIRVGDIISAGGAEGTVKKISARATVIETFEGKEHLIPNKELITGQVINWSLTESAVRVVIPVGVAYGTDVRKAMELLLEAAREVDLVLPAPEPSATFEDFGDNALLLWLRCYVAEQRPRAWTELRTCINDKFKAAGIVIAFPQRDVHLDFSESLKVEVSTQPAS
jgi:potassium efflux system protein